MKPIISRFGKWRNSKAVIFVALFGVTGTLWILFIKAAPPMLGFEPELYTLNGTAAIVNNSSASGGKAVRFEAGSSGGTTLPDPGTYNVTVNFANIIAQLDDHSFGNTVSGYGTPWQTNAQKQCTNIQCTNMKKHDMGAYRVSIQYNNGNPVSGAGGNGTGGTNGDQLIDNIRALGAEPILVIGGKGGQNDMDFSDADARGLAQHYSTGKYAGVNAVKYWIVGNEPSNSGNGNMSIEAFCTKFNSSVAAMKQVYPTLKTIGPAWPYYNLDVIRKFLQCAGNTVDVIDYHAYGQSSQGIDDNIRGSADDYEQQNKDIRAAINSIVPGRANQIAQMVGEYNVSPFANGETTDERFYTAGGTVWNAIATGSILKGGGRAFIFSDQNNPIGMIFQQQSIAAIYGKNQGDPQPAYHGIGMFSGESLFRKFGMSLVQADSTDGDIVVYASNNGKNLVLINKNKNATKTANIRLQGVGLSTIDVWQTDRTKPFDYPLNKGSAQINNGFSYALPPYSVTSVVLR